MPNNVVNYGCTGYSENGGEVVYEFVIPAGVCYEVTVTMTPAGCDLDLFFLGSCDEGDCLFGSTTTGTETIVTSCLEPGTYYIVVDGYGSSVPGAECPFDLTVDCVECDCPVPACCPFENTIYFVDFNIDPSYWLLPCGGAPVWQWGMLDGMTPDIACDEVPITNLLGTIIGGPYVASSGEIAAVGPFFIDQYSTCLELCHFYDIEPNYDGGNVKVSTDGGATWTLISPSQGYPGATLTYCMCIPGEPAYTGSSGTFVRDCFDLTPFEGMEIIVGFFFGSDSSVQYPGWYPKWIKIGSDDSSPVEDASWGNIKAMYR
jgi:hypothetical protein